MSFDEVNEKDLFWLLKIISFSRAFFFGSTQYSNKNVMHLSYDTKNIKRNGYIFSFETINYVKRPVDTFTFKSCFGFDCKTRFFLFKFFILIIFICFRPNLFVFLTFSLSLWWKNSTIWRQDVVFKSISSRYVTYSDIIQTHYLLCSKLKVSV